MDKNNRSLLQISGSIVSGIIMSFWVTDILGIELDYISKILISIIPPILISLWAIKVNRIRSAKLWGIISHGLTYGIINLIAERTFFEGLKSLL